jgi:hypothetical protein
LSSTVGRRRGAHVPGRPADRPVLRRLAAGKEAAVDVGTLAHGLGRIDGLPLAERSAWVETESHDQRLASSLRRRRAPNRGANRSSVTSCSPTTTTRARQFFHERSGTTGDRSAADVAVRHQPKQHGGGAGWGSNSPSRDYEPRSLNAALTRQYAGRGLRPDS